MNQIKIFCFVKAMARTSLFPSQSFGIIGQGWEQHNI